MDDLADLYARHHQDVRRFALFLTGDPAAADDLTSETFVRAWTARDRIAAPSVRGYLLAITRNLWRDRWRRDRRLVPIDDAAEPAAPDTRAEHTLHLHAVQQALAQVAPGDRRALVLHAWAGLSYLDVAARLGVTLAAVKSRISRARSALVAAGLRGGGPR